MKEIQRVSPVVLKSTPVKTEKRDNWEVVMEYHGEGDGPFLVDLSHRPRFDLQDSNLAAINRLELFFLKNQAIVFLKKVFLPIV